MASTVTHVLVGVVSGRELFRKKMPVRFWVLCAISPILVDADTIGLRLGVPYEHFFGHRGFSHSLIFAVFLSLAIVLIFFRDHKVCTRSWWGLFGFFTLLTASHGLLDALTSGGLGVALFSPFDSNRYFAPWTPIIVAPIGFANFFSEWGLAVLLSEARWVWLPMSLFFLLMRGIRVRFLKPKEPENLAS
ncbi:MAG: metal-dependent hydrolase [Phycisphaerales bacterium]|nr:metal-dependent hydrolase [Phycisphaerales bacterium]